MARRQITAAVAAQADDLPDLTAQQMKFVEGMLEGKTATDAYRAAYATENMSNRTIWAEASRTAANRNISAWLSAARQACLGSAKVTLDGHLQQLERIREIALKSGNIGAAVQAEQSRGKASGHYVEQIRDLTDRHDPIQTLRQIATHSPELAASLAAQHGIDLPAESMTKH